MWGGGCLTTRQRGKRVPRASRACTDRCSLKVEAQAVRSSISGADVIVMASEGLVFDPESFPGASQAELSILRARQTPCVVNHLVISDHMIDSSWSWVERRRGPRAGGGCSDALCRSRQGCRRKRRSAQARPLVVNLVRTLPAAFECRHRAVANRQRCLDAAMSGLRVDEIRRPRTRASPAAGRRCA